MNSSHRALIVVDTQRDYFDENSPLAIQYPPREDSLAKINETLDVAVRNGLPIVAVRHEFPAGAPIFAAGSDGARLHPDVEKRVSGDADSKHVVKSVASVFADNDLADWLRSKDVDTITLVGYMTNNCILASAAAAEPLGFAVEVLQDATGAIHLSNEAGAIPARQIHQALMVLLHSNFAAVADTEEWAARAESGQALPRSDLGSSAMKGRADQ